MATKAIKTNFKVETRKVTKRVKTEAAFFRKGLALVMHRALSILEAQIVQNIRSNFTIRSGRLMNSIGPSKNVRTTGEDVIGEIGSVGVPYARIQEFGGVIRPTKGQFLTIPLPPALDAAGLPRITARELRETGLSFIAKRIIFKKMGQQITPMFVLKRSVTIPARPYLRPALEQQREKIAKKFELFLTERFDF